MDHHCWFSDNCVAYYSLKAFVQFTGSVCLLTIVGMSTIYYNVVNRKVENGEGLVSLIDYIRAIITFQRPEQGFSYQTIYDLILIQSSLFYGLFAFTILAQLIISVVSNENSIDALKKGRQR